MADYFDVPFAYNPDTNELLTGAVLQAFDPDDVAYTTPLTIYEAVSGASLSSLVSNNVGALPQFRVAGDLKEIILKSGPFVSRATSKYGTKGDKGDPGEPGIGLPSPEGIEDGHFIALADGEWVAVPPPNAGIREVQIGVSATHLQWRYAGDSAWQNLIAKSELMGAPGTNGTNGAAGAAGESIQMRVFGGYFQAKYPSQTLWTNLTPDVPAGAVLQVSWNGTAWGDRPTARTDVTVWWVGGPAETIPDSMAGADVHWPDAD